MNTLPDGWDLVTLGVLGRYINGRAFKPEDWEQTGLPIIRIQNLTDPTAKCNYYSRPVEDKYLVKKGDLLISWSATLGSFIWDRGDAILNQHIFKVEVNENRVDKMYLKYVVEEALSELSKRTHGATMKHVTKGDFESFKVPVPNSIDIQRQIVARIEALLSEVREMREINQRIIEDTNSLLLSTLSQLFPNPDRVLPEGWRLKTIEEISKNPQYGFTTSAKSELVGPKFLRITDIQNGIVDWNTVPFCECTPREFDRYRLFDGDIVFARTGATTGKTFLVSSPPAAIFASYLIRLQIERDASPDFVYWFFQSPYYWRQIIPRGGAQPNMNAQLLKKVKITIPEKPAIQEQIVAQIESIRDEILQLQKDQQASAKMILDLEQSILAQTFRGEL